MKKIIISLFCLSISLILSATSLEQFRNLKDNRIAVRKSLGVRYARALNSKTVELIIGMSIVNVSENPDSYRIISYDDNRYAFSKFVRPKDVLQNTKKEEEGVKGSPYRNYQKNIIKLTVPYEMQRGARYYIVAQGSGSTMVTAAHSAADFVYQGKKGEEYKQKAVDSAVLGIRKLEPAGPGIIMLEIGPNFSADNAENISKYKVYVNNRKFAVENIGRRTMVDTYLPVGWPFKVIPKHEIFLKINKKFSNGDKIKVEIDKSICGNANFAEITFNSKKTVSPSIKVNQVGYLSDSPVKRAYFGRWLGSFPEIKNAQKTKKNNSNRENSTPQKSGIKNRFIHAVKNAEKQTEQKPASENEEIKEEKSSAESESYGLSAVKLPENQKFHLLNAENNKIVFTGTIRLVHLSGQKDEGFYKVDHSGENVYHLDFTEFKKPGKYFISIPGIGRSISFKINKNVYDEAFKTASYGVFAQRCGIELKPPYSDWRRIACHKNGIVPTRIKKLDKHNWKELPNNIDYSLAENFTLPPTMKKLNNDPALLAHWPLDGNLYDISKNNYHLKPENKENIAFTENHQIYPINNKAFGPTLNGDEVGVFHEYMPCPSKNGMTICGWVKFPSKNDFHDVIFGYGKNKWDRSKLVLYSGWGVLMINAGAKGRSLKFKRIGDNKWHFLAIVLEKAKLIRKAKANSDAEYEQFFKFYRDGKLIGRKKVKGSINKSDRFEIAGIRGKESDGKYFDDFRIYKRPLSNEEINTLSSKWGEMAVKIDACGGHHDAGDYNPRSHIDAVYTLLDAYEMTPKKFYDGQLNIPENKNGIPDILDEAMWGMKLWFKLQDSDGGVRNGTESNGDPNFIQTAELDELGDYAYAKSAAGSFEFAGVCAKMSRIWQSLGKNKAAEILLKKAENAYKWGLSNPPENVSSPSAYSKKYLSQKAFAAAELLRTTQKKQYNKDFLSSCVWNIRNDADIEKYGLYDQKKAAWAYVNCPDDLVNKKMQKNIKNAIINWANWIIKYSSTMSYQFLRHPQAPITWGTGAQLFWTKVPIWAYMLSKKQKYMKWVILSCDNLLGANPMGLSYIVDLGTKTVRAPLHNSRYSHFGEVVKGMTVQGPNQRGGGYGIQKTAYPALQEDFASLYTFVDSHFAIAMDEGTIPHQANNMAIFGFLLPNHKE